MVGFRISSTGFTPHSPKSITFYLGGARTIHFCRYTVLTHTLYDLGPWLGPPSHREVRWYFSGSGPLPTLLRSGASPDPSNPTPRSSVLSRLRTLLTCALLIPITALAKTLFAAC